jgi:hypothetical protein
MEKLAHWRGSATGDTWKGVRKKINDAGIELALLCYNMQDRMKDEDIEYGFAMAKGLGGKAMTTSTTLTMAKRIPPIADKHKMMVGYHGHDATSDPNQTATLESYDTLIATANTTASIWILAISRRQATMRRPSSNGTLSASSSSRASFLTERASAGRLDGLTINWRTPIERFTGLTDWRLQLAALSVVTIGVHIWLW